MFWKKTTPNDGSGFCQNVIFEDDEFKEDNKALNDQGECERELMLFCLQPLQAQFELFQHHKHWICQHKKKTCLQAPEQVLFYKVLQFTFVPKDIVTAQLSHSWE